MSASTLSDISDYNLVVDSVMKLIKHNRNGTDITEQFLEDALSEVKMENSMEIVKSVLEGYGIKVTSGSSSLRKDLENSISAPSEPAQDTHSVNQYGRDTFRSYMKYVNNNSHRVSKDVEIKTAIALETSKKALMYLMYSIPVCINEIISYYNKVSDSEVPTRSLCEVDSIYRKISSEAETEEDEFDGYNQEEDFDFDDDEDFFEQEEKTTVEPENDDEEDEMLSGLKGTTLSFANMEKFVKPYIISAIGDFAEHGEKIINLRNQGLDATNPDILNDLVNKAIESLENIKFQQAVVDSMVKKVFDLMKSLNSVQSELGKVLIANGADRKVVIQVFQKHPISLNWVKEFPQNILDSDSKKILTIAKSAKAKSGIKAVLDKLYALKSTKIMMSIDTFREVCFELQQNNKAINMAKEKIVNSHLKLVIGVARRYQNKGLSLLDLVQEGNLGLIKAVDKFEYRRGCKFSTYACWWIRQALTRATTDKGRTIRIPVHMVEIFNRVVKTRRDMKRDLGREPTTTELSRKLYIAESKIERAMQFINEPTSLDNQTANGETVFADLTKDEKATSPDDFANSYALVNMTTSILCQLDPREERVLRMRFGIGNSCSEQTLEQAGDAFNVTRERVRQIESKALKKMRHPNRAKALSNFVDKGIVSSDKPKTESEIFDIYNPKMSAAKAGKVRVVRRKRRKRIKATLNDAED